MTQVERMNNPDNMSLVDECESSFRTQLSPHTGGRRLLYSPTANGVPVSFWASFPPSVSRGLPRRSLTSLHGAADPLGHRGDPCRRASGRVRERPRGLLLHREGQLQRLLLPALHHLLPELALMLHPLQLGLDVLLRDLQQPQDAVVRLLRDHVQNVPEALRAALAPGLVHTEGHVLRALLPAEELDVRLTLVHPVRVVEARAGENPHHLRKLHHALRERGHAV